MKVSKKYIYFVVIVLFFVVAYLIGFSDKENSENVAGVKDFKKAVYDSLVCQYNCPLTIEGNVSGVMEKLPEKTCTNSCIDNLAATGFVKNQFNETELMGDNFYADADATLTDCRQKSVVEETGISDNLMFYECVQESLKSLKNNYLYLE